METVQAASALIGGASLFFLSLWVAYRVLNIKESFWGGLMKLFAVSVITLIGGIGTRLVWIGIDQLFM